MLDDSIYSRAHIHTADELYISIDKVYANLEDAFCLTQSLYVPSYLPRYHKRC